MLGKKFVIALAALSVFNLSNVNVDENFSSVSKVYAAEESNIDLAEQSNVEGLKLYLQKNYAAAAAKFTEAIQLNPNFASPYTNRGAAYCEMGQYQQAIDDCTKALSFNLDYVDVEAYSTRGAAYYGIGNYSQAIDDCTKSIQLNPEYMYSYYNRGISYYKTKNYSKAIEDLTKVIELSPNSSAAYYNRGLAYKSIGENAKANADFNKANSLGYNS